MLKNEFLAQSYEDAWKDYQYSLESQRPPRWDFVVLTASNSQQGEAYRIQLEERKIQGFLPLDTRFLVVEDVGGERVGSGGATLNVLCELLKNMDADELLQKKVLLLHSGGDAKRIPQYSACGKLFSPVPRALPDGRKTTVFDELMIAFSGIPARISSGMLVMSGDTELLFNPLQLELLACDAAAISMKAKVNIGKEHGVFLENSDGEVSGFLHKQSERTLRAKGAVDAYGNVDIDTGCIWLGRKVVAALISLVTEHGQVSDGLAQVYINKKVCLSFYADFLYPLARDSTLEEYCREASEGELTEELVQCRKNIWDKLRDYTMRLVKLVPSEYLHFGTTKELFQLYVRDLQRFSFLNWRKQNFTNVGGEKGAVVYNSLITSDCEVSELSYIEDSIVEDQSIVEKNVILSNVRITGQRIPEGVVLSGIPLKEGAYVCRIYGLDDNPKDYFQNTMLGRGIRSVENQFGMTEEIWPQGQASLWNARIYPVCRTLEEAVENALSVYRIGTGHAEDQEVEAWRKSNRQSLNESFQNADVLSMLEFQKTVGHKADVENFVSCMAAGGDIGTAENYLHESKEDMTELEQIYDYAEEQAFPVNMRLYLGLSTMCRTRRVTVNGCTSEDFENKAYDVVKRGIISCVRQRHPFSEDTGYFTSDAVEIKLPVRVNFCGSPSDAAPYCLEHGGTMLDGALLLRGERPIQATVKRLEENVIMFESTDLRDLKKFRTLEEIRNCGDPNDTFSLHKAVLLAAGVIPQESSKLTLAELCKRLGGGIYLSTSVDVPKGSGLGTSSIIAAACIKAVNKILNQDTSDERIYAQVFAAEQFMNTGGGWQDQVGGLNPGFKYFHTQPGLYQKIDIEELNIEENVKRELNERFALIFSGQRRLARNVLREEMNQCILNETSALETVEEIRRLCAIMKYELERGNITAFGQCISRQFELVKRLDKGASNTCIEYIFDVCEDLIDGKSVCGAGGGGFLQVILKEGVTRERLHRRIKEEFQGCGVEVWDCTLL